MKDARAPKTIPIRPRRSQRMGNRLPESAGRLRIVWHDHGLSIVLIC